MFQQSQTTRRETDRQGEKTEYKKQAGRTGGGRRVENKDSTVIHMHHVLYRKGPLVHFSLHFRFIVNRIRALLFRRQRGTITSASVGCSATVDTLRPIPTQGNIPF